METVTIHPKDKEQLNTVEAVLKLLKVPFKGCISICRFGFKVANLRNTFINQK